MRYHRQARTRRCSLRSPVGHPDVTSYRSVRRVGHIGRGIRQHLRRRVPEATSRRTSPSHGVWFGHAGPAFQSGCVLSLQPPADRGGIWPLSSCRFLRHGNWDMSELREARWRFCLVTNPLLVSQRGGRQKSDMSVFWETRGQLLPPRGGCVDPDLLRSHPRRVDLPGQNESNARGVDPLTEGAPAYHPGDSAVTGGLVQSIKLAGRSPLP